MMWTKLGCTEAGQYAGSTFEEILLSTAFLDLIRNPVLLRLSGPEVAPIRIAAAVSWTQRFASVRRLNTVFLLDGHSIDSVPESISRVQGNCIGSAQSGVGGIAATGGSLKLGGRSFRSRTRQGAFAPPSALQMTGPPLQGRSGVND